MKSFLYNNVQQHEAEVKLFEEGILVMALS